MSQQAVQYGAAPVAIRSAAWYLPERTLPITEVRTLDETERATRDRLGIETIRADDRLDSVTLAERAARRALDQAGLDARHLGALVMVESRVQETFLSSEVTRLQQRLGAGNAVAFSVGGLGCVSITPALLAARGLLAADPALDDVLVVHGSKPAAALRYRHPVTVNGDGGQALLLSRSGRIRVRDIAQLTDGRYWDLFHIDYRDRPTAQWREQCTEPETYSFRLAVETRNRLSSMLGDLLRRNGLGRGDVGGFVSQNLSTGSLAFLEDALDIELLPACRENLRRYGHLGPNDVFLNLGTALDRGELAPGALAVLVNVSPVAAWSLLLVETGPQEDAA
ncbi:3-oxoacyl-ACP synthase [Kitasatospora sp. NPDC001261]|uniref:3-oxoacyl-ACP synthase n=1 Tax=Kitasatospora sp. NPDC001261 TaxID=3364012 RepID=UPI0036B0F5F3